MSFIPFDPDWKLIRYQRDLPHWRQEGATYFLTFRTADSIPQSKLRSLQELRSIWIKNHPPPWSIGEWKQYHRQQFDQLDDWLDAGYGACLLGDPKVATMVKDAMLFFDEVRYHLDDFVVMPNHVHAIVLPLATHEPEQILHSWKSYTSLQINKLVERKGTFWLLENYDRIVRTWEELERIRNYIRENPSKARLPKGSYILGSGSGIRHSAGSV